MWNFRDLLAIFKSLGNSKEGFFPIEAPWRSIARPMPLPLPLGLPIGHSFRSLSGMVGFSQDLVRALLTFCHYQQRQSRGESSRSWTAKLGQSLDDELPEIAIRNLCSEYPALEARLLSLVSGSPPMAQEPPDSARAFWLVGATSRLTNVARWFVHDG
ncbi:hypothetical protein VNO77_37796 [Canavalia gladiata]|uniref:Uncharacterized protein n=1 Tax=Canavalia gladiata TaxID=3824 RepID=A0AAN9K961_CANGL